MWGNYRTGTARVIQRYPDYPQKCPDKLGIVLSLNRIILKENFKHFNWPSNLNLLSPTRKNQKQTKKPTTLHTFVHILRTSPENLKVNKHTMNRLPRNMLFGRTISSLSIIEIYDLLRQQKRMAFGSRDTTRNTHWSHRRQCKSKVQISTSIPPYS